MVKIAVAAILANWIASGVVIYIMKKEIQGLRSTTQSLTAMVVKLRADLARVPKDIAGDISKSLKNTVVDMAFLGVRSK